MRRIVTSPFAKNRPIVRRGKVIVARERERENKLIFQPFSPDKHSWVIEPELSSNLTDTRDAHFAITFISIIYSFSSC